MEDNRNIAEEIIWAIEEKLKMQRITCESAVIDAIWRCDDND